MKPREPVSASAPRDASFAGEEFVASLFQPDTLVPDQYFAGLHRNGGVEAESRLMLAVLEDAIDCYRENFLFRNPNQQRLFEDAKEWIESADDAWLFSFESICGVLGVDPAYLRQGLLRWTPLNGVATPVQTTPRPGMHPASICKPFPR